MKRLLIISLAIVLIMVFCFNLSYSTPKARAQNEGSSRDVIPPTTYITEDQAHARLFRYGGGEFTNISAANQNISPEVNAVAWGNTHWAIVARGRLWEYDGTDVTEVVTPDPGSTPENNIYPYAAIASKGALNEWLAATLTGRGGMYYDGINIPSVYRLANTALSAGVSAATKFLPVADAAPFEIGDVIGINQQESCLIENIVANVLTVERGYDGTSAQPWWEDADVSIPFGESVSIDWDVTHSRWIVGSLASDFSTHLFATDAINTSPTSLSLTGVSNLKGDYRFNNYTYYLVGGKTNNANTSELHAMSILDVFSNKSALIPNMDRNVTVITGGGSNWLVGGEGAITPGNVLYNINEAGNVFTGTPITTPPELTAITAIGYNSDGNNWLIAGTSGGKAKLYSYDNGFTPLVDLTSQMQTETQAAITTINSIIWNGSYWLIGGAGEFNVSPDVGGSVAAPDNQGQPGDDAKVAFTGGAVDHDSSVSVSEASEIVSDASLKSAGTVYDFTCQDLVSNSSVTQFNKPATINLSYDPVKLGDAPESSLSIYYYDEVAGEWLAVSGGTIDTANKTITAEVNHFTKFGVFASNGPSAELPYTGK